MPLAPELVYEGPDKTARLIANFTEESYFVEYDTNVSDLDDEHIEAKLVEYGLEEMDEDECAAEFLDNGTMVIWCAKIDGQP